MFRFTIRELVLLTLVVAMGVGWWLDNRSQLERLEHTSEALREAQWQYETLTKQLESFGFTVNCGPAGMVLKSPNGSFSSVPRD